MEWKKTNNWISFGVKVTRRESEEMREREHGTYSINQQNGRKNFSWSYLFSSPFFRRKGSEGRGGKEGGMLSVR